MSEGTIGVRPPKEMRSALKKLAKERKSTEGKILHESAQAIIEMIDAKEPRIPWLVTSTRVLRDNGATAIDPERPFREPLVLRHQSRAQSESNDGAGPGKKKKPKTQPNTQG